MSGGTRRPGAPHGGSPQGPRWSPDLLADLHAGAVDERTAGQLHEQARNDPEARELLAALDDTAADLAGLAPETLPDDIGARLDSVLDGEIRARTAAQHPPQGTVPVPRTWVGPSGGAPPVDLDRARRRRRIGLGAGLLTAAAAILGVVTVVTTLPGSGGQQTGGASSSMGPGPAPLALSGSQVSLTSKQLGESLRSDQYGALTDPRKLVGCLRANGVRAGKPMGAREITLDGRPAELLILSTGKIGQFRLLAVGPECGPGTPATLSEGTFGR